MGAVVIALLAAIVLLLAAVGVAMSRLLRSLRQLTAAVSASRERLQPTLDELTEGTQLISVETEHLRRSIAALNADRGAAREGRQIAPTGRLGQVPDVASMGVRR